jgi:hypothetical protein
VKGHTVFVELRSVCASLDTTADDNAAINRYLAPIRFPANGAGMVTIDSAPLASFVMLVYTHGGAQFS